MKSAISRRCFLAAAGAGATAAAAARLADAQTAARRGRRVPIIDSHVHLKHGDAAKTEYSAEAIVEVMDQAGIDKSVVFAMSTTTERSIAMAERAVAKYPDRLIPYAYALPNYERPVIKELESALANGLFRGIKIHAGECTLADYVIDPVLKLAGRFGVPCLIDAVGRDAVAKRLAKAFPETTIIFAHMGRYKTNDPKLIDAFIQVAAEHDKVLLDLSGVDLVPKIAEAVKKVGAGKLVWGTDGPHPDPDLVTYARTNLEKVTQSPISPEEKDQILGGNIARLLKLTV
jgi:predicted TIM-barrel fold metal-dependent hydrolase